MSRQDIAACLSMSIDLQLWYLESADTNQENQRITFSTKVLRENTDAVLSKGGNGMGTVATERE